MIHSGRSPPRQHASSEVWWVPRENYSASERVWISSHSRSDRNGVREFSASKVKYFIFTKIQSRAPYLTTLSMRESSGVTAAQGP